MEIKNSKNNFDKSEVINEYYNNYVSEVLPILNAAEKVRKQKLWIVLFLCIIIPYICFLFYPIFNYLVIPFGLIAFFGLLYFMAKTFSNDLKTVCIPRLINAFGNMKWRYEENVISDYDIQESDIFAEYNRRVNDDSFVGEYKDVRYRVSELVLSFISSYGRRKTYYQVFKGVIILFSSNKEIKNKTIIATKNDINIKNRKIALYSSLTCFFVAFIPFLFSFDKFLAGLSLSLLGVTLFLCLDKFFANPNKEVLREIKLEDPIFNKKYKAYSSDEVEGRYLLTPSFIERFKNLHTAFGSRKAKCSFYDDKIMFSVSTNKNLFEIGNLFVPVNDSKQINVFLAEISAIFDLIDYFKLDEKTGL